MQALLVAYCKEHAILVPALKDSNNCSIPKRAQAQTHPTKSFASIQEQEMFHWNHGDVS